MMYKPVQLIVGLKEAVSSRNEDAVREVLRILRTRYDKPETDIGTLIKAMKEEDISWLINTILGKE